MILEARTKAFAQGKIGIEIIFAGVKRNRDVAFHATLGGTDRGIGGVAIGEGGDVIGSAGSQPLLGEIELFEGNDERVIDHEKACYGSITSLPFRW